MSTAETDHKAFGGWFRRITGEAFPYRPATPLAELRQGIWVDPRLAEADPPPKVPMTSAFTEPEGDYCMAGFWGHGVNSYALYLVERRGAHRCFFRLHFGGAYGDAARDATRAAAFLEGYARFRDRWLDRLEASFLFHEMGLGAARLTLAGGRRLEVDEPPDADVDGFWRRLDETMRRATTA